ncbi:MAG: hypothetical protein LC101_06820 [Flavobacteriales bacterium]|nr:hypothetical protein [Flavobacteriales bacterium]
MTEIEEQSFIDDKPQGTPRILKIFIIISIIVYGFQFLSIGSSWLFKEKIYELEDSGVDMTTLLTMLENTNFIIIHLLSSLLVIVGVVLLWKLKRIGFFMYMAGKIVILTDVYLMGIESFSIGRFLIGFIFWAIWPIVFISHYHKYK